MPRGFLSMTNEKPKASTRHDKWPPINPGTEVITTKPNMAMRKEWSDEVWKGRQWGVRGKIITHHDAHGLSYEVRHPDGSIGGYDPSEFRVVS
jgi:hypothetical protein